MVLTAATVIVVGYRSGRTHAAWRDMSKARRAMRATRHIALHETVPFIAGTMIVLATLFTLGFSAAR
jgi:hypothetical protein